MQDGACGLDDEGRLGEDVHGVSDGGSAAGWQPRACHCVGASRVRPDPLMSWSKRERRRGATETWTAAAASSYRGSARRRCCSNLGAMRMRVLSPLPRTGGRSSSKVPEWAGHVERDGSQTSIERRERQTAFPRLVRIRASPGLARTVFSTLYVAQLLLSSSPSSFPIIPFRYAVCTYPFVSYSFPLSVRASLENLILERFRFGKRIGGRG